MDQHDAGFSTSTPQQDIVGGIARMRIRHDGDDILWEIDSPDGTTTLLERQPEAIDLGGFLIAIRTTGPVSIAGVNAD